MPLTLEHARALDAADPLRDFRARFALPPNVVYLDGNSLGPPPVGVAERLAGVIGREWGEGLVRSWNEADWIGAPARVGGKIARLVGAAPHQVVVTDSTSINVFKALAAAVQARPGRRMILAEAGNFPTDLYMAQGLAALAPGLAVRTVPSAQIAAAIDTDVAVVLVTHVHYKTAARADMAGITATAHGAGALTVFDLSHSAGAVAVDLVGADADLAVGCGYKFLNGGPGAPAWIYVADRLGEQLRQPLAGWMGHAAAFAFRDDYQPAPGVARFLCGTPPILSVAALEAGVDLALTADMAAIEAKSAALWDLFDQAVRQRPALADFVQITPADPAARGSHIAFSHPEGFRIMQALIARGVIGDFRDPDVLRFGLTPLYLGFEDVWRAVEILEGVMRERAWADQPDRRPGLVT